MAGTTRKVERKAAPKASADAAQEGAGEASTAGSLAAVERLRARAEALPASAVLPCRADVVLAQHNAQTGIAAVLGQKATVLAAPDGPRPDWAALGATREVAEAVVYAALQVTPASRDRGLRADIAEAYKLREVLLSDARTLALKGIFPAKRVAAIAVGRGTLDAVEDCVTLAALYHTHAAALRGKTAVSAAEVRRAAELGAALVAALSPKQGRKKAPVDPARAAWVALRDRLWTLLVQDYRAVQRVGAWLWLGEAGEHVPGLQARVLGPRKKAGAEG